MVYVRRHSRDLWVLWLFGASFEPAAQPPIRKSVLKASSPPNGKYGAAESSVFPSYVIKFLLGWWGEGGEGVYHGRRNFKDTNPLMSSLLVIFVGVVTAILQVLNLARNRV